MGSSIGVVFDLDGTLVDSVYQHVLAWHEALQQEGIELSVWRIHRKIGMSGGLFAKALLRETGRELDPGTTARLQQLHVEAYMRRIKEVRPLPGAKQLLGYLTEARIPWGIATSGRRETAAHAVELLGMPGNVTVVTRDDVVHAKPDPGEPSASLGRDRRQKLILTR
jgi:phosphoglycolate phosphatase-like HAD superfamily hydrolase